MLLLSFDIVAVFVDNHKRRMGIKPKQQYNESLAGIKRNDGTEEAIIINIQSGNRTHLPSAVVVATVLVLLMLLLQQRILWKETVILNI